MFEKLFNRLTEKLNFEEVRENVQIPYPGYLGEPSLRPGGCQSLCRQCETVCPSHAISIREEQPAVEIDLGRCLFCGNCMRQCGEANIRFTKNFRLAVSRRAQLTVTASAPLPPVVPLDSELRRAFINALNIRFIAAGDCGGCRMELEDLFVPKYDMARHGITFVESPLQANALMVSGPVTPQMRDIVWTVWHAMPDPKLYIALGACNISGGHFTSDEMEGVPHGITPDLYIPGCPPHPATVYYGLLAMLGIEDEPER